MSGKVDSRETQLMLIFGSVSLIALSACLTLLWAGLIVPLNILYCATAVLMGVVLYAARPSYYVGFCLYLWILTPFVRRLIDFQAQTFSQASLVLLTPYIVTGVSAFTVVRHAKELSKRVYAPFGLSSLGVLYGYGVGILSVGLFSATYNLLEWLVPVLFGCHILMSWRDYPALRRSVTSVFTWAVLVMGVYGIIQFLTAPPWDTHWMLNASMDSVGHPEPFRIRVFSLLNSPGPFAMYMMAGLLVLFSARGLISRLGIGPGYVAFLLSLVRTAWGAWAVALVFVIRRVTGPTRQRLIVVALLAATTSLPLLLLNPISDKVSGRLDTLGNLSEDNSMQTRVALYSHLVNVLSQPIGNGLGSLGGAAQYAVGRRMVLDSGVVAIPYTLGWLGTFAYVGGWLLLLKRIILSRSFETDAFAIVSGGIATAFSAALLFANQLIGPKGILAWTFLALATAAISYHEMDDAQVTRWQSLSSLVE